jgi:hypothetical protein
MLIRKAIIPFVIPVALACGGRSTEEQMSSVPKCVPGEQLSCACSDGAIGAQTCDQSGAFEPCSCAAPLRGSGGAGSGVTTPNDTGSDFGNGASGGSFYSGGSSGSGASSGGSLHSGGSGGTSGTGNGTGTGGSVGANGVAPLISGTQSLIDLFVSDAGLLIVLSDEVRLMDRSGSTLQSVHSAREITAAAFDGSTLVVADKAKFTSYDLDLTEIVSADLAVTCSSAILMDNGRFVCGQNVDWDRVYYTYDAMKGTLLASSKQYTYDGIPMRRAPKTNQFVAVEVASSPANLFLYELDTNDEVNFLGDGPFEISDASAVYAFVGNPADRVVIQDGTMLTIDATKCTKNNITAGCFTQDGTLGTLTGAQRFIGMDNDLDGNIYAIVDPSPTYTDDRVCSSSCLVQQIDVATRTVTSQSLYSLPSAASVATVRHDATGKALVVGYTTGSRLSSTMATGYGVVSLPY